MPGGFPASLNMLSPFFNWKLRWFTAWEGEEDKKVEESEFENINHHSAEGHLRQGDFSSTDKTTIYLKWSQVGVDGENVDKLQRRKYVCSGKKTLQSLSDKAKLDELDQIVTSDMRVGSQASQSSLR